MAINSFPRFAKFFTGLLVTLHWGTPVTAQSLDWVRQLDPKIRIAAPADNPNKIPSGKSIVDADGYIYMTGHFSGTADFDPGAGVTNLTSSGGTDIFISAYRNDGNFLWAKSFGGSNDDAGGHIAFDASKQHLLVTGSFRGKVDFDPSTKNETLSAEETFSDIFVCKYNLAGNLVWAKNMGGNLTDAGSWIGADASDNIYIGGYFEGSADFNPAVGAYTLAAVGASNSDRFIASLKPQGDFSWAVRLESGEPINQLDINGMAVSSDGELFIAGGLYGKIDIDPDPAVAKNINAISDVSDIILLKLSNAGAYQWHVQAGGTKSDWANKITLNSIGDILVSGSFTETASFGGTSLSPYNMGRSAFIWKMDKTGNHLWVKAQDTKGNGNYTLGMDVTVDPTDKIYSSGSFMDIYLNPEAHTDADLTKGNGGYLSILNKEGKYIWGGVLKRSEAYYLGLVSPYFLALDAAGNLYVTGAFETEVDFDPSAGKEVTLNAGDATPVFLARFSIPTALPAKFGTINALWNKAGLTIKWRTESETHNSHFNIEFSEDGRTFTEVATMASKHTNGHATAATDYTIFLPAGENGVRAAALPVALLLITAGWVASIKRRPGLYLLASAVIATLMFSACKKHFNDAVNRQGDTVFIRIAQVDKDGKTAGHSKVIRAVKE
ncbi:hypothetical protein [Niabella aurantiaca]|uniref:hypothetical protein n=1 Tax=Niabella aurantiaca TaxID=379900 RepID=UPI000374C3B2|nr:hypothetical protein [Niabella aurantiaca]